MIGAAALATGCREADPLAEVRALQQRGDLIGSLEPLRGLIAERPDDPEVHFLYGSALTRAGHVSQGAWSLEKAMEDPRWRVAAGVQLADGALRSGNYPGAIAAAGRVLDGEPDQVAALLIRAEARARAREDLELALADVDRVLELEPDRIDAQKPRILALLALDRTADAEVAIDELGHQLEESEAGRELAGWHCAMKAVFSEEKAIYGDAPARSAPDPAALWADCLERFPGDADVALHAVAFYDARGERDRSLAILRTALEQNPSVAPYRSALAERLRTAGENEQAEALLREAASSEDPHTAVAAGLQLAEHHQALGAYAAGVEAADRAIERARSLGPVGPQLLFEQADALVLAGELDRALAVAEQMTLGAHRALVRARVAQERRELSAALRHYDEAFRLWPDNGAARFMAALAAEANGEFDRAIEQYRYAIRIAPNDLEARTRLARLHLAERQPEVALEVLQMHNARLDADGELLALRLWAQLGETQRVDAALARIDGAQPTQIASALASVADGLAARGDPRAAVRFLREQKRVRLGDPQAAAALRALVRVASQAGQHRDAAAAARAARAEHPEASTAHELVGLTLELGGAPSAEVHAAYARALELDAENGTALSGLARLALARDPGEALALFDRAAAADSGDADAKRGAATALAALGRRAEAEQRLAEIVVRHPLDRSAAEQLAALQLERGAVSAKTVALARRAIRLGGGPQAWELLSRIHAARGDPEKAASAGERARALSERSQPVPPDG